MSEAKYDFDNIFRALNLLPYSDGAFNPAAVVELEYTTPGAIIHLQGGLAIELTHDDLMQLDATIKRLTEENKTRRLEAIKDETNIQADARLAILRSTADRARQKEVMNESMRLEAEIVTDMQSGVQGVIGAVPTGKRFRQ